MKKFLYKLKETIERIETSKIPFLYSVLTFFFAATLRNFFETYFNGEILSPDLSIDLYHYYLSYICLSMVLIILFHFATKEKVERISRLVLPCFLILILAPIIDLIISPWRNFAIGYMFPGQHQDLLLRFLTFFGSLDHSGVTPGMRIEMGLVIFASYIYFFIKNKSIIRSLAFSFLTYCVLFVYCAIPFVFNAFINMFRVDCDLLLSPMSNFYLFLIFILSTWIFYLYNKRYFIEILKDTRFLRLLHFELMFIFGIILSEIVYRKPIQFTQYTLFYWFFLMVAIACAWLFSVMTNNLVDYEIDKISNRQRPTVSMAIPQKQYRQLSWIFFICALVYSSSVNFKSLFLILLFLGNYFMYSMPPLRLKRIPFFSKLPIALNSLVLIVLGQFSHSGNFGINTNIIVFFLICITAALNFIDIKDYEGDKSAGIKTLPTIFGLKRGKQIIGLFFLISYLSVCFVLRSPYLLIPAIILGIIQFYLINRKNYSERPVLTVYLFTVVILIVYLKVI